MRAFLFICFFTPLTVLAQSPVQWKAASVKLDSGSYELHLEASLDSGWYLYAENDAVEGVEKPSLSWSKEAIERVSTSRFSTKPQTVNDPIFSKKMTVFQSSMELVQKIKVAGDIPSSFKVVVNGFAANDDEFIPVSDTVTVALEGGTQANSISQIKLSSINVNNPVASCGHAQQTDEGLLAIFLLGFAGGLIALLTPCVFPMIPVTVTFFTNKSVDKKQSVANGFLYGFFIVLIYLLASIPFHLLGNINPEIFNSLSTNAGVNLFFFIVFVLFAVSFFGGFEFRLPAAVSNMAGSKSGLASKAGIFFMALTLAIVSFSCTGPILGSLLVGSLSSAGGAWQLTAGMGGFGLALALPFGLFAMFPQWMKRLPKSGSWMEVVKRSLAFIELALAIKFLSNADPVEHWGILKREVFIGSWIIISLALSLYLLGILERKKKPQSSPVLRISPAKIEKRNLSKTRMAFGLLTLAFALYLTPGITQSKYANLKLLSGFPPPLSYSIYGRNNVHGKGLEPDIVNDYQKAVALAKQQHKPILIDFTGWACVNCRKMEEQVWTKPEIAQLIKENFILVSLYVDDRQKLPAQEQSTYITREGHEKDIITVGDKYATMQAENFGQVTQPMYAILSSDERLLNHPVGYTPSVKSYKQWLECAVNAYREQR